MKRILAIVLPILAFAMLVTVPLFIWGGQSYSFLINQEKAIAGFILVTLELAGIAFSIVIVVFVIIQYAQYVRSRRFVFDGFSNESKLNDALKTPLDLGILAREELVNQFEAIYNELKGYYDNVSQDFEAFAVDELYIKKDPSGNNIGRYVSVDQIKTSGMIEDLKEVIWSLKDPKGINLMKLAEEIASKEANNMMAMAEEIAPKEISPILKFIEAVIPPHIIRATGHLQGWRDKPGKVGITFEFVDLGSQRNLMVRTIWWSPDGELNKINNTLTNKMTHYYIELLSPAMHWMALMFWEQNLISQVPPINRILNILNIFNIPNTREKRRQARLLALLSLQYFASALQFRAYNSFFIQLAIEHFRQALVKDSSWSLPYLYLANLYSFMALESTGEMYEKLLKESRSLYKQALEHTKETNVNKRPRIIIALALAELASGVKTEDEGLINKAIQEVEELQKQRDPADFDPDRADCAAFLYNLAIFYEKAYDNAVNIPNVIAKDEARRYLAYSLVRPQDFWDAVENDDNFKSMREEGDLEILKKKLAEKLREKSELKKMTGENFKAEISEILKEVDQTLGRGNLQMATTI